MSSASAIPQSHVPSVLLRPNVTTTFSTVEEHHQDIEWPALSSPTSTTATRSTFVTTSIEAVTAAAEDWELLHQPEPTTTASPFSTVRIVEPAPEQLHSNGGLPLNCKTLKHCRSSPDLRHYVLEDNDDASSSSNSSRSTSSSCASSGVLIHSDDVTTGSSSVVMVLSTTTSTSKPSSPWASKVSFKDTLMKTEQQGGVDLQRRQHHHHRHQHHSSNHRSTRKFKPKLVVVQPTKSNMSRSAKSTGDLRALDENDDHSYRIEDDVLGETDAQLYYNQKAQGELGRRNGRKQRPDEAKRLEITMAKKSMQRERMAATAASGKR